MLDQATFLEILLPSLGSLIDYKNDLVILVLRTAWYTLNSQFYQKLMALQWEAQHLQLQQNFICRLRKVLQYLWYYTSKVWERFADDVCSILKCTHLENLFHHINNLHQNIKFSMVQESNWELAFFDTLLKRINEKISISVYRKPIHTDQYLHYSI